MLNDCTLTTEDGLTTQIDHILLSPYGVFVIETKNYKGWIYGGEHQKMWTQSLYKNKYKFQNPLHQNYKHTKVLEHLFNGVLEPQNLHSVVVFVGESTFKTTMPHNVFQGKAWVNYVKSVQTEVLSDVKVRRLKQTIEKYSLEANRETQKLHLENLKQQHSSKNSTITHDK